ncbi:hypothetical protein E3P99_02852 [Wallemia hederae]|uniref:Zn(2)-C6 fungal-type domain-containing protein n=1 Tax=Wallemia hederae TaxID=1540922 RepID=A0A4V4LSV9_9BASI|nr:hypothetical protein E3P99_02852 [Wallemia hederae]
MMMDDANSADHSRFSFPASILNERQQQQREQAEWDASSQTPQPAPAQHQQSNNSSSTSNSSSAQPPQPKIPISRVTRACDRCTHKKLRCDGTIVPDMHGQPPAVIKGCTRCMFAHTPCEYTRVQKRRGPSPGFKRRKLSNESAASSGSMTGNNKNGHTAHSPASSIDSNAQSQQFSLTHRRRTLSQQSQSQPQSQPSQPLQYTNTHTHTHTPPPPPALKTIPTSAVSNAPPNFPLAYSPQPPLQRHHSAYMAGMASAHSHTHSHSHSHSLQTLPTTPSAVKLPSIANWFGPRGHPSLHR